jgi:hypothetical protein
MITTMGCGPPGASARTATQPAIWQFDGSARSCRQDALGPRRSTAWADDRGHERRGKELTSRLVLTR